MLNRIKTWAFQLKLQARVLQIVYNDPRTPVKAKIIIWIALGYIFSPIDLIPDFIPVLGLIDDILIVPMLIALAIKLIPQTVWADAEQIVEQQPLQKWKLNWIIIALIGLAWLCCFYFIYYCWKVYYFK